MDRAGLEEVRRGLRRLRLRLVKLEERLERACYNNPAFHTAERHIDTRRLGYSARKPTLDGVDAEYHNS